MRRPNLCSNTIGVADDAYKPANSTPQKEENRLSLVRRVLGGSRKKDGNSSTSKTKQFGVPIIDLPLNNNSVPKILHRICFLIEAHGMKMEGLFHVATNTAMMENLKSQFNTDIDFDFDTNDVSSVAMLLLVWLNELPQPLFTQEIVSELISLMNKYDGDTWWGPVCHETIQTAGLIQANVLETILHLLNNYTAIHPLSMSYIPGIFSPLLTLESKTIKSNDTLQLTTKLIKDYNIIFRTRNFETSISNEHSALVVSDNNFSQKQRKRKERQDSLSGRLERKFVRSNSEERPVNPSCSTASRAKSMRRVSSHEDFSKTPCKIVTPKMTLPLQERNSCSPQRQHPQESMHLSPTVGYASDLYDENEHERRRNHERFAPQRFHNVAHRRRTKHHHSPSQSKENDFEIPQIIEQLPLTKCYDPIISTESIETDNLITFKEDDIEDEEDERSTSPISGVCSPLLDLNTLQSDILTDPVASLSWNNIQPNDERLISPRNSLVLSRRTFTACGRADEEPFFELVTQINNLKRKIKKFGEGFEKEFGYKPSHGDKMANSDTKKLCVQLGKLKKQLRAAKEESLKISSERKTLKEEVIEEIEKRLNEKRILSGRPEDINNMTHDELLDEKGSMQKALLQLEASFGRPSAKEEKDMVRNLYDRYRNVKRMILRQAPSKMKDSISELGTILEHEAMDFSTSPPPTSPGTSNAPESPTPERKTPDLVLDNLHSLPPNELFKVHKQTRDEKKKLRQDLKDFEKAFQAKMGRKFQKEDRCTYEPTYVEYKNAKAKLRFIEALITKLK